MPEVNCRNTIILLSLILSLYSCKKEKDVPDLDLNKIVFGDAATSGMSRQVYDPPMQIASWANGGYVYDSIDINNDGTFDFALLSYGQKWANSSYAEIYSLHDSAEILVEIVDDTVFQCSDNQNPEIAAPLVMFNAGSGFNSYSQDDSIISISGIYYPRMFMDGDEIIATDSTLLWRSNALFTRYAEGFSYYPQDLYLHYRYGYWNDVGIKYLCYRLKDNSNTRYGWLMVSIEYYITINVFEYSISILL
jgi:hypothetical protein